MVLRSEWRPSVSSYSRLLKQEIIFKVHRIETDYSLLFSDNWRRIHSAIHNQGRCVTWPNMSVTSNHVQNHLWKLLNEDHTGFYPKALGHFDLMHTSRTVCWICTVAELERTFFPAIRKANRVYTARFETQVILDMGLPTYVYTFSAALRIHTNSVQARLQDEWWR